VLATKYGAKKAQGLELDSQAADYGRKTYGVDIRVATIEEGLLENRTFDVITAFDVIEHVKQPVVAFDRIARALRPGGIFLCITPNGKCISRWGRAWIGLQKDMEHLMYPRAQDLQQLGKRFGLQLIHSYAEGNPLPMRQYSAGVPREQRMIRFVSQPDVLVRNAIQKLRFRLDGSATGHNLHAVLQKTEM
jgi:SAM-dependent methyltransferase